ncbi:PAS domain-containing protein [Hymenobacter jejuensis]|uniref:histidine kinase n=1 Tax=Hymenobacter jejuensis TaxID=2502781 RepID=A0A5B7ZUN4_9BACT|nr:PAS domain-containing protein [Hymenobacter jejuensis]QDA58904.1 PAS domain S-box protein [Hymenobacter jejuensis]
MASSVSPVNYQSLFRSLPDNYLLLLPDGTIADNSDNHVKVSLKSRAEVVGKPFFEAFPAADQNEYQVIANSHEHVRQHLEPHTMPLIRYDLERPAALGGGFEERYWQATHYPLLDEQGQLQYILQRTQDVTEQHQAALRAEAVALELEEARNRSQFILESLPIMVWTTLPDGRADYSNPRYLQFTGLTPEAMNDWGWTDNLHPDDRERVLQSWQQAVRSGSEYQIEYRLRRADGQYRWLLVRGVPRFNENGQTTMWVGCSVDIHDQKTLVQELLQANEQQAALSDQSYQAYQLVESQNETFQTLLTQAPALITILRGKEHVFDFVNPMYQALFPDRQLLNRSVAEAIPEAAEQGFSALLDQVYQTGETFFGKEILLKVQRPNTNETDDIYLDFTYQAFKEGGQIVGVFVFAFDVTEVVTARKKLENFHEGLNDAS